LTWRDLVIGQGALNLQAGLEVGLCGEQCWPESSRRQAACYSDQQGSDVNVQDTFLDAF
jgi:hypothetical protein